MSRRFLAAAVLLMVVAASAFAVDFGVTLTNGSTLVFSPAWDYYQMNQATLWLSLPVGSSSSLYLSGLYEFSAHLDADGSSITPWRIDVGRLEWEGTITEAFGQKSSFSWSLGRVNFNDFSGRIVANLFDGLSVKANFGNLAVNAGAAYTGLSYKRSANMFLDEDDAALMSDANRYFAPARLVALAGLRASELANSFDIGLDAFAQFDMESGKVSTNSQYIEPFAEGRAGRSFRYRAWMVLGLAQGQTNAVSMAAGGRGRWSFPELAGMRATLSALWASATTEKLSSFCPIAISTLGSVSNQSFSDVTAFQADLSVSPLSWLSMGLNLSALMSGNLAAGSPFTGFETSLAFGIKPASDFSVDILGGLYSPYADETPLKWMFSLAATLAL